MIKVSEVSKSYGHRKAIDNISFEIKEGEVVGFLGPNGAGKTTTMKMLTGFMAPSSGSILIDGVDIFAEPLLAKKSLRYLPETPPLYVDMTVDAYLTYVCALKGVPTNNRKSYVSEAVEKLKSDSKEILRPIKTSIGKGENEFKLPRTEAREKILQAISGSQFTIVTGKPGVGKSAEIKEIIQTNFPNASVFVFRADQFNESTLANVFSSQGVNETIQDIFSCISLIPEKIIFIDSLEKLLEADPECAFKQLLALLKEHPEIKIIASSRKYAIDLITLKFGIDKNDHKKNNG